MGQIYVGKVKVVKKFNEQIEKTLGVSIKIDGGNVIFSGEPYDEYASMRVFEAIRFGFSVKKALALKDETMAFKVVHIKSHTRRQLKDIRARLIGTKGKTRRVMADISGCEILIKENEVGIIGDAEEVGIVETAIINLIRGSKQSNMYQYLERMNRERKKLGNFDK